MYIMWKLYHLYKVLVISVNFDINQIYYLELALILSQHDLVRCYKVVNIKDSADFTGKIALEEGVYP